MQKSMTDRTQINDTCKRVRTKFWSMDTKHNKTGTHRSEIQARLLFPTPIRKFRLVKQFANGQQVPLWPPRTADLDLPAGARRPQVAGAQALLQSSACQCWLNYRGYLTEAILPVLLTCGPFTTMLSKR